MSPLALLADRVERLLLRHREMQRTNELLTRQLDAVSLERDHLRTRLTQARQRLDEVLARMPQAEKDGPGRQDGDAAAAPRPSTSGGREAAP
jgi:ABC-type phosphate transport system auxiliary subunit